MMGIQRTCGRERHDYYELHTHALILRTTKHRVCIHQLHSDESTYAIAKIALNPTSPHTVHCSQRTHQEPTSHLLPLLLQILHLLHRLCPQQLLHLHLLKIRDSLIEYRLLPRVIHQPPRILQPINHTFAQKPPTRHDIKKRQDAKSRLGYPGSLLRSLLEERIYDGIGIEDHEVEHGVRDLVDLEAVD